MTGGDQKAVRLKLVVTVLALSLAGNFLAGGFILGHYLSFGPARQAVPATGAAPAAAVPVVGRGTNLGQRIAALPQEERQRFMRVMRPAQHDLKQAREEMQAQAEEVVAALGAEPYDPNRMRRAFAALREKTAILQEATQNAQADALTVLSPESRRQLASPEPGGPAQPGRP